MRLLPRLLPALLPALLPLAATGCAAGLDVAVFHRTLAALAYSAASGRDCSAVRLDRGESYCRAVELPVPPQPYCTRSLAGVDCWAHPEQVMNLPPQVAQGPRDLTPEQDRVRLARWPGDLR